MTNLFLQLHITGKCNLRCKHCYIDEHSKDMSYKDVKRVLRQFDSFIKFQQSKSDDKIVAHIHMTGGEPFLHPEIKKILWLLIRYRHKYQIGIMSNGTVLTIQDLILLRILKLKAFQVSIDGNEKTHDSIRGEGNCEKVISALDRLYQWHIPTRVSFTANNNNFREFPQVAEMCRAHHVKTLWSDRYIPFEHNESIAPINLQDMQEYINILKQEKSNPQNAEKGLIVQNYRALQFLYSDDTPYSCAAGENLITIDEKGNILPCRRLPIICGNINTTTILDVYYNNETFVRLRNHYLPEKCEKCEHSKSCKGGERCFTYAIEKDYEKCDPCCWISKQN